VNNYPDFFTFLFLFLLAIFLGFIDDLILGAAESCDKVRPFFTAVFSYKKKR
jgi:hypothetical protein